MSATITDFIIAIMVFCLVFTGLGVLLMNSSTNYDVAIDPNFSNSFDEINGSITTVHEFSETMEADTEGAESSAVDDLKTLWSVLKLPFQQLKTTRTLITEVSMSYGIPNWFRYGILTILTVTLTGIIIAIIFKRHRT